MTACNQCRRKKSDNICTNCSKIIQSDDEFFKLIKKHTAFYTELKYYLELHEQILANHGLSQEIKRECKDRFQVFTKGFHEFVEHFLQNIVEEQEDRQREEQQAEAEKVAEREEQQKEEAAAKEGEEAKEFDVV